MTLNEWDKTIAPHLHCLEGGGRQISLEVGKMHHVAQLLSMRPNWPTLAEDEMEHSIMRLERLAEQLIKIAEDLRSSLHDYRHKSIE